MCAAMGVMITVGAEHSQMVDFLCFQISQDDSLFVPGCDLLPSGLAIG